jgi:hypothetical protein
LASGREGPTGIVLDATNAYWIESGSSVMTMPLGGGAPNTLVTGSITSIALDETFIYWTDGALSQGSLMAVPKAGGTPATLVSGQTAPNGVAVDSVTLYWTAGFNAVMRMAKTGGKPLTLASEEAGISSNLFLSGTRVCWSTSGGATIVTAPVAGGQPTTIAVAVTPSSNTVGALAIDDSSVYWTYPGSGTTGLSDGFVLAVGLDGGVVTTLASLQDAPIGITIDASSVYWTTSSSIRELTPK